MDIIDQDGLTIPLPDGTRLSARIWRPASGAPVPAILEYIPYRKRDNTLPRDETIHPWMAAQGYACLRVDVRGNGDSEGVFDDEYSPTELQDACDVIAWIAAQDWCSGNVGMMGKSWGGFNCLQTAFLQPPALKAVVSVCSTVDRFADDIHFKGGCLLGENFGWGTLMLSYASRPADPLLRPDWREDLRQRIETLPHLSEIWSNHQARDAYWKHGSICEDYSRMNAAVLSIGGWADNYMNTPAHIVENVAMGKAIVGPWVHQYPHTAVPGPRIGFLTEMKTWWDRWLKGIENGAEDWPDYRSYMMTSAPPDASAAERPGYWVADTLPSPHVNWRALPLSAGGVLGDGPAPDATIRTKQTLGAAAGEYFPMGLNGEMAGDQRDDDAHSVCFDTPLPDGLRLLGAATLSLRLTSDKPFAFVCARLCDVAPDGSSTRIAHGLLNLHHRSDPPTPLTPGEEIEVELVLDQMAYEIAPGHRLRLALSNTYWPFVWPSPEIAALRLSAGTLSLPVHDGKAPGWTFADPEVPPPGRLQTLSESRDARSREIDMVSGVETYTVISDSGETQNPDHGLIISNTMVEIWSIHPDDPLSASCRITWTQHFRRGDWSVDTRVEARQTGTTDALVLDARLSVHIKDGAEAPETIDRNFHAQVARQHV